jgi:dTDP-4-dehydrorhamnose 3,5-epimerase
MDQPRLEQGQLFTDARGWVLEAWRADRDPAGVQDNLSWSEAGVLRGLHYQEGHPQGKWLRVLSGSVFDVVVDLRPGESFLKIHSFELSSPATALWIPPGFAHGFYAQTAALVWYRLTGPRVVEAERVIRWDDPRLGISWPFKGVPVLSERDAAAPVFKG